MTRKRLPAILPFAAIGLCAAGPTLSPDSGNRLIILGNSQARACAEAAQAVADGKMSPNYAVETCTDALNVEQLTAMDAAATHNNRGVVRLGMIDEAPFAVDDFNAAAKIDPDLGETYVNRGAVLMREQRWAEAIEQLNHGIELGLKEPWRAYYNRGVAHEGLDNLKAAYADYQKALEMKPDWAPPKEELARFVVKSPLTP